jgi:putative ABC transport system permease protein
MTPALNFKIAIRSITKNKVQSLISIIGLGIGLGCILLITMLYLHENSFNRDIPQNDQIYRVIHGENSNTPFPLGEAAAQQIPAIEKYFRYYQSGEFEIKNSNNSIVKDKRFACADQSIFDDFGVELLIGRAAESINDVAISEQTAQKYFKENPVNKELQVRLNNEFINLTVCGVYENFPANSTLAPNFVSHTDLIAEFLGSRKKLLGEYGDEFDSYKTNWDRGVCQTYIKLNEQSNVSQVCNQLQGFSKRFKDVQKQKLRFSLQAVSDIYLHSENIVDIFSRRGNANELKYYIAIALVILLIAVTNYIFLTKAKMNNRLKEMGIKRALGATAGLVRRQLLFESNLISLISLLLSSVVIALGIPFINSTLGSTLDTTVLSDWYVIPVLLLIPLFAGTISGLIVGFNISKVSPIRLLNKKTKLQPKKHSWNNSFLSLHFAIFIVLIVGVLTLKKQIDFALTNFTAINPKNIIIGELNTPELSQKFRVIKNKIEQLPGVISIAGSSFIPPFNWTLPVRLDNEGETVVFDGLIMGKGMTEMLDLEIIEGDHFGEFNEAEAGFIYNESAALKYNLKAGELFNGIKIRGIVKDFTAHSMHNPISPMVIIQQHPDKMGLFAVKTTGDNDAAIKDELSQLFQTISPDKSVNIYTLEEQINQFYNREQNQAKLISAFLLLAFVLSVMGLLGMVMNTVTGKTKEIGIRKVNGATVIEIVKMLNYDFLKWVVIAFVIAVPFSWYIMSGWLQNFAYKIEMQWWFFALAGVLVFLIALITVSCQTFYAARRNPVDVLRYE